MIKFTFILFVLAASCTADSIEIKNIPQAEEIWQGEQLFEVLTTVGTNVNSKEDMRVPLDLVLVIDSSGSMAGDAIHLLKNVLLFLIEQLTEDDQLSIIEYNSGVTTLIPPMIMDEKAKVFANVQVRSVRANGGTYLSGGASKGAEICFEMLSTERRTSHGEAVPVLVVLSDGYANVGNIQAHDIFQEIRCAKNSLGCSNSMLPFPLYTFGIGKNVDHQLMSTLAELGNGAYFHVADSESIGVALAGLIGNLFETAVKSVKLHIEIPEHMQSKVKIHDVFSTYTIESQTDSSVVVYFGDIQVGSFRNILVTLEFAADSALTSDEFAHDMNILDVWWEGYDLNEDREVKKSDSRNLIIKRVFSSNEKDVELPQELQSFHERKLVVTSINEAAKAIQEGHLDSSIKILNDAKVHLTSGSQFAGVFDQIEGANFNVEELLVQSFEVGKQRYSGSAESSYQSNKAKETQQGYLTWNGNRQ